MQSQECEASALPLCHMPDNIHGVNVMGINHFEFSILPSRTERDRYVLLFSILLSTPCLQSFVYSV